MAPRAAAVESVHSVEGAARSTSAPCDRPPLFDPADFVIPSGITHVCAGGESAPLRSHLDAFVAWLEDKAAGPVGRDRLDEHVVQARAGLAARFGVALDDVGIVSSVAEGMSALIGSIDWRPGDNVCVAATEFPSLVVPVRLLRAGPEVKVAPGSLADPPRFEDVISPRTRMVAVSHVSYWSGLRLGLADLRSLCDAVGALLVVDFTQSAGVLPTDASVADFAFAASFKWLLGGHGAAAGVWNRERQPDWQPRSGGWNTVIPPPVPDHFAELHLRPGAARLTPGNVAYPSVYLLENGLRYLDRHPTTAVAAHVEALAMHLLVGLGGFGIDPLTPLDPTERAANVAFRYRGAEDLARRLAVRGVLVWGSEGRLRVSVHGYNNSADIERVLGAISAEWREDGT
ncbi:MAG: aminotransferase class V-fold PLP-dependent enzyme [Chloroflexota bacterium]